MPGFKVRYSKFRHVYGQPFRREQCYDSVRISRNTFDGNFCAVNPKFLAVITESGGGGSFIVIPIGNCGRVNPNSPRVLGHSAKVLDIKWYPFNDQIIASSSEDGTVILWEIPEDGLTENLTDYMVQLKGHGRKCGYLEWHPTSSSILASGGFDGQVIIWNIDAREAVSTLNCGNSPVLSLSFNWNGSLIATTSKDKKLRLFDPRTEELLQEGICHHGMKSPKCAFVGDADHLVTVGTSRSSQREIALWDQNDFSKPLAALDLGNGTGVLFLYVDHDNNVVYVAGKGDGNIRYFEILESRPHLYALNEYVSGQPQRGMGSMPKRGLVTANCEVMRFYKLHATKEYIEPVSMIVPRRYDTMQRDLYPDTAGPEPAMTAREWISGIDRPPVLVSLGGVSRKVRQSEQKARPSPLGKEVAATSSEKPPISLSRRNHSEDSKDGHAEAKKLKQESVLKYETEPMEKTTVSLVSESGNQGSVSLATEVENMEVSEETDSKRIAASQGLDSKDGKKDYDKWDIIEEEAVTATSKDIVESAAPDAWDDGQMHQLPDSSRTVNGSEQTPPRTMLVGMEGSLSVSQRLARWQNNNNQSYNSRNTDGSAPSKKLFVKPEKRSHSVNEGTISPERKSQAKMERSYSESGKETFRIDNSGSVLPAKRSSLQSKEDSGLVISATSPRSSVSFDSPDSSPSRKTSLPDKSGDGIVMSRDMGADQIRKAYLRQQEEIKHLKGQLHLKDARIRQLEKELEQYTTSVC